MLYGEAQQRRLDSFTMENTEKVSEEGKVQPTGEGTKILFLSLTVH